MIFPVSVVLGRTIVDIDWCFDNLCGSHLHTQRYYHCHHHHHHQHDHHYYHHHHHHLHSSCQHKGIMLSGLFYPLRVSLLALMQVIKRWKLFQRRQTANNYRCCWKYVYAITVHHWYLLETILVYSFAEPREAQKKPHKMSGMEGGGGGGSERIGVPFCSNNLRPLINCLPQTIAPALTEILKIIAFSK